METKFPNEPSDNNQNYKRISSIQSLDDSIPEPSDQHEEEFEDVGEDEQANCTQSSAYLSASGGTELYSSFRSNILRSSLRSNSSCGSSPGRASRRITDHSGNTRASPNSHIIGLDYSHSRQPSLDSQIWMNSRSPNDSDIYVGITMEEIDGTMSTLEDRVAQLDEELQTAKTNLEANIRKNRILKAENQELREKLFRTEEQLKDNEVRWATEVKNEEKRYQECLFKLEKTKNNEIDELLATQYDLEDENGRLKVETNQLKKSIETYSLKNTLLEERLQLESQKYQTIVDSQTLERDNLNRERINSSNLIDELCKELEELKAYKLENEKSKGTLRTLSVSDLPWTRYDELEQEISNLRHENKKLKSSSEELEARLLNYSLAEGRRLLRGHNVEDTSSELSFAAEVETMTKDEIMEALREQREVNGTLREYVDKILLLAIEKNPSILEIDGSPKK